VRVQDRRVVLDRSSSAGARPEVSCIWLILCRFVCIN
jgi:hypothetical protein